MKGKFITFEGLEGSGKSTQIDLALKYLKDKKCDVMLLREPGGVQISEKIRKILLDVKNVGMSDECETLLYMAARAQLVHEVLIPELQKGTIVICDRFLDSTIAYQGYGNGVDTKFIERLGAFVTHGAKPDLTFLFDIEAKTGLSRIKRAKDRIELRAVAYHNRVRQGYLMVSKKEPKRVRLIDVNKSKKEIQEEVKVHLDKLLGL